MYSSAQVNAVLSLLKEGCTIPFIARYRKERTGGLDEVQILEIEKEAKRIEELKSRKEFILKTIEEQGKLTAELKKLILEANELPVLEDLYLPFKPKRKTRATIARDKGLEPLAKWLYAGNSGRVDLMAERHLNEEVKSIEDAIEGAKDIIAEWISENSEYRTVVRSQFERFATIKSRVARDKEREAIKYKDYHDFEEPLKNSPSHRLLAMLRGEEEGMLRISISPDEERTLEKLNYKIICRNNETTTILEEAVKDSYRRLLSPSIENEFRNRFKEKADEEAIRVFAENLRQLLLGAPLGQKRILALDPGFRTGCKLVVLSQTGDLMHDDVIYPNEPQNEKSKSATVIQDLISKFNIEAVAVGNGTAGRETEWFLKEVVRKDIPIFSVNEAGASIYSASEIARTEFPDKDVTVRGAVSIGRRLVDPLSELVKIDPKSIGVGQYQHDVDQSKLKSSLDQVVLSCVNSVGVNLNSAGVPLLQYVSGLGPKVAEQIVAFREKNGPFKSREELLKVPKLGAKTFEQSVGFLRIPDSSNPLDNTGVHPERFEVVKRMSSIVGLSVKELAGNTEAINKIDKKSLVSDQLSIETIDDIILELSKPGRDPRSQAESFEFSDIRSIEDVKEGMILPGIVTNITNFGCFVNIGIKQEGLVHISHLANKFIKDPMEIVRLQQKVKVKVLSIDLERNRVQLSMKDV